MKINIATRLSVELFLVHAWAGRQLVHWQCMVQRFDLVKKNIHPDPPGARFVVRAHPCRVFRRRDPGFPSRYRCKLEAHCWMLVRVNDTG